MNIAIIGLGVAGATAAETVRKLDPKAYITIFNGEKDLFYYRPRLPEVVAGTLSLEKVIVHPKDWFRERRLELRMGESAVAIDPVEKTVRGSLGSRLKYDRLLLATGASSNRLPLPGANLSGVFAVRSLNDAWELSSYAKGKERAVLIGGGILGLEMAYALTKLGLKITVLERSERILPRQTTPESAAKLSDMLSALGLECRVGVETRSISEAGGKAAGVTLADGENIEGQVVLMSAGIVANLELAKAMGLKTERGVLVDKYLESGLEDVYAAGDCAQPENCTGGLWTVSQKEGLIAGENLVAERSARREFVPEAPSSTLKVAGMDLVAAGNLDPEGKLGSAVAQADKSYRKVVVDQGRLVGYTNVGTTKGNRELAKALSEGRTISPDQLKALENPDFDFAGF